MPRRPESRDVLVSKKLSWLLRHGAEKEGLKMDEAGFVNCADVLANRTMKSFKVSFDELREIVATNSKKRFELISVTAPTLTPSEEVAPPPTMTDPSDLPPPSDEASATTAAPIIAPTPVFSPSSSPRDFLIRASQGHSLKGVSSELLLTPLDPTSPRTPPLAVHATTMSAWNQIQKSGGLSRMGRAHVHFTAGTTTSTTSAIASAKQAKPSAGPANTPDTDNDKDDDNNTEMATDIHGQQQAPILVTAGFRNARPILIWADVKRSAHEGALKWWVSANGVVLTEGNEKGLVGLEWIDRVEKRLGGGGGGSGGKVEVIWRREEKGGKGVIGET